MHGPGAGHRRNGRAPTWLPASRWRAGEKELSPFDGLHAQAVRAGQALFLADDQRREFRMAPGEVQERL